MIEYLYGILFVFLGLTGGLRSELRSEAKTVVVHCYNCAFDSVVINGGGSASRFVPLKKDYVGRIKHKELYFTTKSSSFVVGVYFTLKDGTPQEQHRFGLFKLHWADQERDTMHVNLEVEEKATRIVLHTNYIGTEDGIDWIEYYYSLSYPDDCQLLNPTWPVTIEDNDIYVGQLVWVNDVFVGNRPFGNEWRDQNGYIFPHRLNGKFFYREGKLVGETQKLKKGVVIKVEEDRILVRVYQPDGLHYDLISREFIGPQGVILINW